MMITAKNNGEQVVEKDRTYSESKTGPEGNRVVRKQRTTNISRSESTVYAVQTDRAARMWSSS
ncbi:MAG: hypothetical protein ACLR1V_08605 [Coprococcus sp.]